MCWAGRLDADDLTPSALDDMDPACIDAGSNLEIFVLRDDPPPPGTVLRVACDWAPASRCT